MNYLNIKNSEIYYDTRPDTFYKGIINPIEKKTIPYLLTINSIFRDNYLNTSSTNFFYDLPLEIKNIVSLKVIDIQIPNSYYNIHRELRNNFFIVKNESTNKTEKIIIPDGNYTNRTLINTLNAIFSRFTDEFQYIYFYIRETTDESQIGETIIALSDSTPYVFNFTIDFDADFMENTSSTGLSESLFHKLGWILGFRYNNYSSNSVYVSEGFIETQTRTTAFLYLDDFNKNYCGEELELIKNQNLSSDFILSSVNLRDERTILSSHNIFSTTRNYLGVVNIKRLHVKLLDNYGKIIDLNISDWNFTIKLELLYNL